MVLYLGRGSAAKRPPHRLGGLHGRLQECTRNLARIGFGAVRVAAHRPRGARAGRGPVAILSGLGGGGAQGGAGGDMGNPPGRSARQCAAGGERHQARGSGRQPDGGRRPRCAGRRASGRCPRLAGQGCAGWCRDGGARPDRHVGPAEGWAAEALGSRLGRGGTAAPGGYQDASVEELDRDARAELLLRAMINAAKADGQIDGTEMNNILGKLDEAAPARRPRTSCWPRCAARSISTGWSPASPPEAAAAVYAASTMAIKVDTPAEQNYLVQLAAGSASAQVRASLMPASESAAASEEMTPGLSRYRRDSGVRCARRISPTARLLGRDRRHSRYTPEESAP